MYMPLHESIWYYLTKYKPVASHHPGIKIKPVASRHPGIKKAGSIQHQIKSKVEKRRKKREERREIPTSDI